MGSGTIFRRLRGFHVKRILSIIGIVTVALTFVHLFTYPFGNYLSSISYTNLGLISLTTDKIVLFNGSNLKYSYNFVDPKNDEDNLLATHEFEPHDKKSEKEPVLDQKLDSGKSVVMPIETNLSLARTPASRKKEGKVLSINQMNTFLLNDSAKVKSKRPRWSSPRNRELQNAKFQIENARIERNVPDDVAALFRNYSTFKRSYELMERTLKVYVYKEGEKPFFHSSHLRGIYASEGWFMKLMERNKQFVVKDPAKAHLFYLPFSSLKLRNASNSHSQKDIENHLKNYVGTITAKYPFWNKSSGEDHFLVACHDWAPRSTRKIFETSIRVLCNSNLAGGFKIGSDVSLPVTYIRSSENPSKDIGGNSLTKRPFLAFFAGGMHGNVRPILLHHWQNKYSDMKILGPMPRDPQGKEKYREFMKSSKYCISAKGYEVHTPRVVESIYYECVPVIISDNYVPPFFEILNWESFAVFVTEDEIPNLRNILLSISDDRYVTMRRRMKIVQRYFVWHKVPVKYDLFHMILHSVWYNRVFQFSGKI